MGKKAKSSEKPTRKSVLKEAAKLREAAARARQRDPNVTLYAPTDDAASRLIYQLAQRVGNEDAPAAAIVELYRRARVVELRLEEHGARASAARSAHRMHLLRVSGERDVDLSLLSLGERLDRALLVMGLVSEAPTVRALDAEDRVSGGKGGGTGLPRIEDRHGNMESEVRRLVEWAEREAQRARRYLVEEGTAA